MKVLVLRVFLPSEFASVDEYEYAVLPLTDKLAKLVSDRREMRHSLKDKDVCAISFLDKECQFFKIEDMPLTDDEMDEYMDNDWVVVERDELPEAKLALRMHSATMNVFDSSICWEADPLDEDVPVETAHITYADFEEQL